MTVPSTARSYPIPAPVNDPRFSLGLVIDVIRVLGEHGYPRIEHGRDIVALQSALFGFLYAPTVRDTDPSGLGYSRETEVPPAEAPPLADGIDGFPHGTRRT